MSEAIEITAQATWAFPKEINNQPPLSFPNMKIGWKPFRIYNVRLRKTMELLKLIQATRKAEQFIYEQYYQGFSGVEGVTWDHDRPHNDALLWMRKYKGAMTLAPDRDLSQIHIYCPVVPAQNGETMRVEFPIWMNDQQSDLTAQCKYDAETESIHIGDIHVL